MALPGGLVRADGTVDRTYAWKPVDGTLELALAAAAQARARPEAVSQALAGALEQVGGAPASLERIDALSVPDRRFLIIELAHALGLSFAWWTHRCAACGTQFDFSFDLHELPVMPAGECYPTAEVKTTCGRVRLRVPTGADQARLAAADDDAAAAHLLAELCISPCDPSTSGAVIDELTPEDLAAIDEALEELAPKPVWAVQAPCPDCGSVNVISIDAAAWLAQIADGPTREVHEIALAYGWNERDILTLPRAQRQKYLALIRGDMQPN
jgi:hypothetical protein